jgi:hypothetical protein
LDERIYRICFKENEEHTISSSFISKENTRAVKRSNFVGRKNHQMLLFDIVSKDVSIPPIYFLL